MSVAQRTVASDCTLVRTRWLCASPRNAVAYTIDKDGQPRKNPALPPFSLPVLTASPDSLMLRRCPLALLSIDTGPPSTPRARVANVANRESGLHSRPNRGVSHHASVSSWQARRIERHLCLAHAGQCGTSVAVHRTCGSGSRSPVWERSVVDSADHRTIACRATESALAHPTADHRHPRPAHPARDRYLGGCSHHWLRLRGLPQRPSA